MHAQTSKVKIQTMLENLIQRPDDSDLNCIMQ